LNFLLSLEEDVEVLTVAVDEADTVDPVESSRRLWTVESLVVMLVCRVSTSSSRLFREVFWVSVHVTEAEEIWLAMVLTEELVALNPTTRSKYHRLQCDCSQL